MTYGYDFYFDINSDVILFPITPGELIIKVGSNNKVVTLISEGDINILKSPTLTEVKFEARFPMRDYPYSRPDFDFTSFHEKLTELKEEKKSFRFIVARRTTGGSSTWDTNLLVALEDFTVTENADEGDDVLIEFNLKQFKEYGVKVVKNKTTNTVSKKRPTSKDTSKSTTYTVKSGDCLWNIAKAAVTARWWKYNLVSYMKGNSFTPKNSVTIAQLKTMFSDDALQKAVENENLSANANDITMKN